MKHEYHCSLLALKLDHMTALLAEAGMNLHSPVCAQVAIDWAQ